MRDLKDACTMKTGYYFFHPLAFKAGGFQSSQAIFPQDLVLGFKQSQNDNWLPAKEADSTDKFAIHNQRWAGFGWRLVLISHADSKRQYTSNTDAVCRPDRVQVFQHFTTFRSIDLERVLVDGARLPYDACFRLFRLFIFALGSMCIVIKSRTNSQQFRFGGGGIHQDRKRLFIVEDCILRAQGYFTEKALSSSKAETFYKSIE